MKDVEKRGIILQKYYDRRREGLIQLKETDFDDKFTNQEICHISKQLGQHDLIEWKPVGESGLGEITAFGVDVIEKGSEISPIEIVLDNRQINITDSKNVQIGDINIQDINIDAEKIITAINSSSASSEEKEKAKSLFQQFIDNPLVKMVLGKVIK